MAREYSEQLGSDKLIEMFSTYNSWEGLFYYLGAILTKTEDKEVHFKYIEAAAKVGNMQEVERVTREDNFYDPERVRPHRLRRRNLTGGVSRAQPAAPYVARLARVRQCCCVPPVPSTTTESTPTPPSSAGA